ncbi:alpha/beta hydrolase domain-containing protein [Nocardia sp. FBN12]|uniref:alpha/beta hydrolase domain-containing protein n=1 Tax=Nocardia sp. FBN12 TaxID=3419766 RepID=UPI003CFEDF9F
MNGVETTVVSGPVTGGTGRVFYPPLVDLASYGYVEEEFFLEGEAVRYTPGAGAEFGWDGHWLAEPVESAAFKTRIVVYRPADPQRFNGTAFVCWNNVSGGIDNMTGLTVEMLESGSAAVGVTVQRTGVHGIPGDDRGLVDRDSERYGSLFHPGDDYSFDIFTQAARALRPARDRSVDPMGGLPVRKLIAHGQSQSAGRVATYINAVHPLVRAYDGFVLELYFGFGPSLTVGDTTLSLTDPDTVPGPEDHAATNVLRDDLDVPVMIVNTELEATVYQPARQPDTDLFRTWEVAGATHVSEQYVLGAMKRSEKEFGTPNRMLLGRGMNRVPFLPVLEAAYRHMVTWVNGGPPPPVQPRIEFVESAVSRDRLGVARGGIQLPQIQVPLARHDAVPLGADLLSWLIGSSTPFTPAAITLMYGDEAAYLARFEVAARDACATGVLLERDVPALVAEARSDYRRWTSTETRPA